MINDDFADRLIKENKDEFDVFLDTLKETFEYYEKKGNLQHENK